MERKIVLELLDRNSATIDVKGCSGKDMTTLVLILLDNIARKEGREKVECILNRYIERGEAISETVQPC